MIGHQHDTTSIGEFFHDTWGVLFIAMALLHVLSSAVHHVVHRDSHLAVVARAFLACAWMFNGLWACLMGLWINVWGDRPAHGLFQNKDGSGRWTGTREVLFPAIGQDLPSGDEEGLALLSAWVWLSGLSVAIEVFMTAGVFERRAVDESKAPTRVTEHVYGLDTAMGSGVNEHRGLLDISD